MSDLLNHIRENPHDGTRWLALALWLFDNGREDESLVVRTFWPVLRDNLPAAPLDATLDDVARNAGLLSAVAREMERRAADGPDNRWPTE